MVFHLSVSDSKSPQVSRTLLGILADLNNFFFVFPLIIIIIIIISIILTTHSKPSVRDGF